MQSCSKVHLLPLVLVEQDNLPSFYIILHNETIFLDICSHLLRYVTFICSSISFASSVVIPLEREIIFLISNFQNKNKYHHMFIPGELQNVYHTLTKTNPVTKSNKPPYQEPYLDSQILDSPHLPSFRKSIASQSSWSQPILAKPCPE